MNNFEKLFNLNKRNLEKYCQHRLTIDQIKLLIETWYDMGKEEQEDTALLSEYGGES